ncbi:cytochrome P450 [Nesidiocoris tenuis]|uniref:Cytochrome P450 n=1 Tax=Nesidiocoris tenuis TaxID=355587 RepID=A0ABN7B623_9HEMI|nr:cytochrome P450 [Nesidiocoris tenuis]
MILTLLLLTWLAIVAYIWRYASQAHKFWSDRGVPHVTPLLPIIGNAWLFIKSMSHFDVFQKILAEFPHEPLVGAYVLTIPVLIVQDRALVEHVLIKDFHHFTDRVFPFGQKRPHELNLLNMRGKVWRAYRNKFTPMFTTSKVRNMLPQMKDLALVLLNVVQQKSDGVDLKETFVQYSLDVVASTAFGLDTGILKEEKESVFRRMIKKAHRMTTPLFISYIIHEFLPPIAKRFRPSHMRSDVVEYFSNFVKEALRSRKNGDIKRNDFLQLMVALQEEGFLEVEQEECDAYLNLQPDDKKSDQLELNDDVMIGQALMFLFVGLDATSTILMYLCYELAMNPDVQEKVRAEVKEVVRITNNMDYDTVKEMHYLEQCIKETLRLHTLSPALIRVCSSEYQFPGTEVTIPAGVKLFIPISTMHLNEDVYPEPGKFDPDRFSPETRSPPCSYLPFGDGPRMCLAIKFVMTEMKCVIAKLLMRYTIKLHSSTEIPLKPYEPSVSIAKCKRRRILFDLERLPGATC